MGVELFHKLIILLRKEYEHLSLIYNLPNDIFERTEYVLFQEFNNIIEKNGDLRQALENKIKILKEFIFQNFDLNYKSMDVTIDDIIKWFKKLRIDKINFYKAVLDDYKNRDPDKKNLSGWNE